MRKSKVRLEIMVRVVADLALLNASLFLALVPQIVLGRLRLISLISVWLPAAVLINVLAPFVFYAMGFYTKGR